jgi:hypothetical protein
MFFFCLAPVAHVPPAGVFCTTPQRAGLGNRTVSIISRTVRVQIREGTKCDGSTKYDHLPSAQPVKHLEEISLAKHGKLLPPAHPVGIASLEARKPHLKAVLVWQLATRVQKRAQSNQV